MKIESRDFKHFSLSNYVLGFNIPQHSFREREELHSISHDRNARYPSEGERDAKRWEKK